MKEIDTTEVISALLDEAVKGNCSDDMVTKLKEVASYLIETL